MYEVDPWDPACLERMEKRIVDAREQALAAQADYWDMIDGLPMKHPEEDDAHE